MLKKNNLLSLIAFLSLIFFVSTTYVFAQDNNVEAKGGIADCKIKGGDQNILRKVKAKENSAFFKEGLESIAGFEVHGSAHTVMTDLFFNLEFELNDIDTSLLRPGGKIIAETSDINLVIRETAYEEDDFAIVASNIDENSNPIKSKVTIKTREIKARDTLGRTSGGFAITFPKTVVLCGEDLDKLDKISGGDSSVLKPEDISKIDLSTGEENGSITVTCQYKNLP